MSTGYVYEVYQPGSTLVGEYEQGGVEIVCILKNSFCVVLANLLILLPALSNKL